MRKWVGLIGTVVFALQAQEFDHYASEPIIVTANRFPTSLAEISRSVTVIDSAEIRAAAHPSVQELLLQTAGIDLMRRGPGGVQADVSLRGASFENALVLIDGVRVNDPQTAHHTLNLPLSLNDIERIEIVRGGLSGLYGADAAAGVINIITRSDARSVVQLTGGQGRLFGVIGSLARTSQRFRSLISFESRRSDGYAPRTAYNLSNLFCKAGLSTSRATIDLSAGYNDKAFDANAFYSSLYPNEWEHTRTWLAIGRSTWTQKSFRLAPQLSYRRHFDDFVLDKARPNWFRNRHTNHTLGAELPVQWLLPLGRFGLVTEWRKEWITSTNLGSHRREYYGLSASWQQLFRNRWDVNLAIYGQHTQRTGLKAWPGADVGLRLGSWKLFTALHSAFRIPSFTELYYKSPANIGNPNLQNERSQTAELGLALNRRQSSASVALFRRSSRDLIDWVRNAADEPWRATNIGSLNTIGLEMQANAELRRIPSVRSISVQFTTLYSSKETTAFQSKYALRYLRRHAVISLSQRLPLGMETHWTLQVKQRLNEKAFTLLDLCWIYSHGNWRISIKGTNLFDTDYYDFVDVPAPGRLFTAALQKSW